MSTSALNIAIESLFATAWGSTTPVRYDNVPFVVPLSSWVALEVWDGLSGRASLGYPALRRTQGVVYASVYTQVALGGKPARDLADAVVNIFRDIQVSGITFEEPDVKRIGEQSVSSTGSVNSTTQWFQMVVAVPFFYDVVI